MKPKTETPNSYILDLSEYENDLDFKNFRFSEILSENGIQTKFIVPNEHLSQILSTLRTYKVNKKIDHYFIWSYCFLEGFKKQFSETKNYGKGIEEQFTKIKEFVEFIELLHNEEVELKIIKLKFKKKDEKSSSITINSYPTLNLISSALTKIINSELFKDLKLHTKENQIGFPNINQCQEAAIMHNIHSLKKILNTAYKDTKKKEPFELREIHFIIGKILQLAGVINSKNNDSESHIIDILRKRIESFEKNN